MQTSTLLHKQLRFKRLERHKLFKSLNHSFGDRQKNINTISEKASRNKFYLFGEEASPDTVMDYFNHQHFKPSAPGDAKRRSVLKSKIKKWLDNEKTTEAEKIIFQQVLKKLENNRAYKNSAKAFENIDAKISRRNDKLKCLSELELLHADIVSRPIQAVGLDVELVELLFKIPDAQQVNLSADSQQEIITSYYKNNLPDYPIIATAQHFDEGREHIHMFIDGKSKYEGFNFPDEMRLVMQHVYGDEFLNKQYRLMSDAERKRLGELNQKHFYEHANNYLIEHGYDFFLKLLSPVLIEQCSVKKLRVRQLSPLLIANTTCKKSCALKIKGYT